MRLEAKHSKIKRKRPAYRSNMKSTVWEWLEVRLEWGLELGYSTVRVQYGLGLGEGGVCRLGSGCPPLPPLQPRVDPVQAFFEAPGGPLNTYRSRVEDALGGVLWDPKI